VRFIRQTSSKRIRANQPKGMVVIIPQPATENKKPPKKKHLLCDWLGKGCTIWPGFAAADMGAS
jgi:hypothetical protein